MRHERTVKVSDALPVIQKLTEVRLAWGLTSRDMAQRIGCGYTTFSHWEAGHRDPSMKALVRWASILGYDLSLELKGH